MISQNPFGEFDDTMKNLGDQRIRSIYGLNPEVFYNLPYEIQNALMQNYWEMMDLYHKDTDGELKELPNAQEKHNTKIDNIRKKIALRQYEFEENVRVKILSIFKKK